MLDLSSFPMATRCDVQQFRGAGSAANPVLQQWLKPRGASMAFLLALGPGGGGGSGFGNTGNSGGGGGGESGAAMTLLVPTLLLPDALWINCPPGGAGGVGANGAGTAGAAGAGPTVVQLSPNSSSSVGDRLCYAAAGNGGGAGANLTAGLGGTGAVATTGIACPFSQLGIASYFAPQDGGLGSDAATLGGGSVTWGTPDYTGAVQTGVFSTGGGGGGGSLTGAITAIRIGGAITASGAYPGVPGGPDPGTGTSPAPGNTGFIPLGSRFAPFSGGSGAAGSGSATGGAGAVGGAGGPGGGGGGGGGGWTAFAGGNGGRGGDGYVLIVSW